MAEVARQPGLWRNQDFRLFWVAEAVSLAGTLVTSVALPILVYRLSDSAFLTSLTTAFGVLPYLFFGFFAGVVADRIDRRRLMIVCDILNALLIGSIPVAGWLGLLTLWHILGVALGSAILFVWFDAANWGAVPALVGRERVVQANSLLWTTTNLIEIFIPSLAGGIIALISPSLTIGLDAISYLLSAFCLVLISRNFNSTGSIKPANINQKPVIWQEIGEGLRFIWQQPIVRMMTLLGFGNSFTGGAILGLLIVYLDKILDVSGTDGRVGILYTAGAIGSMVVTLFLPQVLKSVPVGYISLMGYTISPLLITAMVFAPNFVSGCVFFALWSLCYSGVIQNAISFRQIVTPDNLLSRVNTTARMIGWGGTPFGAAVGGMLAQLTDIRTAFLFMALAVSFSAIIGWFSPLRSPKLVKDYLKSSL